MDQGRQGPVLAGVDGRQEPQRQVSIREGGSPWLVNTVTGRVVNSGPRESWEHLAEKLTTMGVSGGTAESMRELASTNRGRGFDGIGLRRARFRMISGRVRHVVTCPRCGREVTVTAASVRKLTKDSTEVTI